MRCARMPWNRATPAWTALVALLAVVGCLGQDGGGGPTPAPPADCDQTPAQQVVNLINAERARQGLPTLAVDSRLAAAAQAHSEDQAAMATLSHLGSTGSSPSDRISAAGYPWVTIGENVAGGQATADEAVDDWMDSSVHRAAILNASYEHLGVGFAWATTGAYPTYWTVDFGSSSDGGMVPADGCHP